MTTSPSEKPGNVKRATAFQENLPLILSTCSNGAGKSILKLKKVLSLLNYLSVLFDPGWSDTFGDANDTPLYVPSMRQKQIQKCIMDMYPKIH